MLDWLEKILENRGKIVHLWTRPTMGQVIFRVRRPRAL